MKYNITIKNAKVQDVADVEELNVQVEYSVGEIPEILGHVLPFIERLTGEVVPKLMDKIFEARVRIYAIEAEDDARREAARGQGELCRQEDFPEVRQASSQEQRMQEELEGLRQRVQSQRQQAEQRGASETFGSILSGGPDLFGESFGQVLREAQADQEAKSNPWVTLGQILQEGREGTTRRLDSAPLEGERLSEYVDRRLPGSGLRIYQIVEEYYAHKGQGVQHPAPFN